MENKELKDRFIDERTGIEYIRHGDYYLLNLIDTASVNSSELGRYGRMRLRYLKQYKCVEYTSEKSINLALYRKLHKKILAKYSEFDYNSTAIHE